MLLYVNALYVGVGCMRVVDLSSSLGLLKESQAIITIIINQVIMY